MFAEERLEEILKLVNKEGKVFVKDLSIKFNVSEGMIRKDLQRLENKGSIKRTYGGAISNRNITINSNINNRIKENTETKLKIAKKAFDIISDNDTIFLDISSINYNLASLIANSTKKLTLITSMSAIPPLFNSNSTCTLIVIGGVYNKDLGGCIGSETINTLRKYRFNKAFIGSCGVNLCNSTLCNFDLEEGNTKQAILSSSRDSYLLIENEKFYHDGVYTFATLDDIDSIITESTPSNEVIEVLQGHNISIF
ncbi:DeoR/GlpR family DNA-binding transcription regulator [Clostridium chauvoei]|uniref:DeoR/GlpR family DNA-binding transcription regulator n=1 Tax=Clostridium chauvoei TaxID=46867 RepID=UPI002079EB27|nr:DeoR/GlpR family DNA-binding transcription regulator [Clostridium chauvoei]